MRNPQKLILGLVVFVLTATSVNAQAHPTLTQKQQAEAGKMLELLTGKRGAKFERPSKTAILGAWNEGEAGKSDCGDGRFFYEFKEDGYAYSEVCLDSHCSKKGLGDKQSYVVTDEFIEVGGGRIYQVGGDFYRASHECFLVRLFRVPSRASH